MGFVNEKDVNFALSLEIIADPECFWQYVAIYVKIFGFLMVLMMNCWVLMH